MRNTPSFIIECETVPSCWTHQLPPYSFICPWDEVGIERFVTLCSVHKKFIVSRRFIYPLTHVRLGFSFHVSFFSIFLHTVFFPLFPFSHSFCHSTCLELSSSLPTPPPFLVSPFVTFSVFVLLWSTTHKLG